MAKKATPAAKATKAKTSVKKPKSLVKSTDLVHIGASKASKQNKNIQTFSEGDTVGVYVRVREGDKERVQLYKGVVLKMQGKGVSRSFTVRKISAGVGVERTFPFASPSVDKVELIARGKVRRSKLYFLRNLRGKAARLTSELVGLRDEKAEAAADDTAAT